MTWSRSQSIGHDFIARDNMVWQRAGLEMSLPGFTSHTHHMQRGEGSGAIKLLLRNEIIVQHS